MPEDSEHLQKTWKDILEDVNHHIIVNEIDGKIISSCVCVIIPNLTRNIRPYAFIENVVTNESYRGKGYSTECLDYAKTIAIKNNCYKMMLLTGTKIKVLWISTEKPDITVRIRQHLYSGLISR